MRRWSFAALLLLAACDRPVDGRSLGATLISRVEATPKFVRAGTPVTVEFRVSGTVPEEMALEIAGIRETCVPQPAGADNYRCTSAPIDPQRHPPGGALVVVEATDADGKKSVGSSQVTIDFEPPRLISIAVGDGASPAIIGGERVWVGESGTDVALVLEVSEELSAAPAISRNGVLWGPATGAGLSYTAVERADATHPAAPAAMSVTLTDLAGNTTNVATTLSIAIDESAPMVDGSRVLVERGPPGEPSTISATVGAFLDDVGVREIRVFDETGVVQIAAIEPRIDGALSPTSLRAQPSTRVVIRVIDHLGRSSAPTAVQEEWTLTLGNGTAAGSALRVGSRYSQPPPETTLLANRTADLATRVAAADGVVVNVVEHIGFEQTGTLPHHFEDRYGVLGGYDRAGKAAVLFGGSAEIGIDNFGRPYYDYDTRTTILRWDEELGEYRAEAGPEADPGNTTPHGRNGTQIAFNGRGCGLLFGGDGVILRPPPQSDRFGFLNDVWQICWTPSTGEYRWREIVPENAVFASYPNQRITPLVYDPLNDRWVIVNGLITPNGIAGEDVFFLEPNADPTRWRWEIVTQLPSNYSRRWGHFLYWDPLVQGVSHGFGTHQPRGNGEQYVQWTYQGGQWLASEVAFDIGRQEAINFAFAYDSVRHMLVTWTSDFGIPGLEPLWIKTRSATTGPESWRNVELDAPFHRTNATMLFDEDREVILAFGGFNSGRVIGPELYALDLEPNWPITQTTIALAATKPRGVSRLELEIVAAGSGDADGLGPSNAAQSGFEAWIWSYDENTWTPLGEGTDRLQVALTTAPERFVSAEGRVTITVRSKYPATQNRDARLSIDAIGGRLILRSGVSLP